MQIPILQLSGPQQTTPLLQERSPLRQLQHLLQQELPPLKSGASLLMAKRQLLEIQRALLPKLVPKAVTSTHSLVDAGQAAGT